jgi:hypothetical protein
MLVKLFSELQVAAAPMRPRQQKWKCGETEGRVREMEMVVVADSYPQLTMGQRKNKGQVGKTFINAHVRKYITPCHALKFANAVR